MTKLVTCPRCEDTQHAEQHLLDNGCRLCGFDQFVSPELAGAYVLLASLKIMKPEYVVKLKKDLGQ